MRIFLFALFCLIPKIFVAQPLYTFQKAVAMDIDVDGNLYLLDKESVYKLDKWGGFLAYKNLKNVINKANDIDAKSGHGIFVADTQNHRILQFDKDLNYEAAFQLTIEAKSEAQLLSEQSFGCDLSIETPALPTSIAIDYYGDFYFIDQNQHLATKQAQNGTIKAQFATESNVNLVAFDGNGILYLADPLAEKVLVYDTNGSYLYEIGNQLKSIVNINVVQQKLLVTFPHLVHVYSPSGRLLQTYTPPFSENLVDSNYSNGFLWLLTEKHLYGIKQ